MSQSESDDEEVNRREVAYRLFAAEFEDADFSYAESDEERAPNYVVTPTGARVNRLFVVGVLTEVEQVNDDVVRARVVDPTGAFVVYAGQYQPEALAALESAETPSFVAVTGKARTFEPDDSDVVYTSIRPETVSEVDAETRDRWVVTTAERTVDRVATTAAAHERVERGDQLQSVLEDAGVDPSLASGIPRALDHYGTTPAYLAAVRDLAVGAARVVSGDAESAGDLDVRPDQTGDASLDFTADLDAATTAAASGPEEAASAPDVETEATPAAETAGESETTPTGSGGGAATEEAGADDAGDDNAEAGEDDGTPSELAEDGEPSPEPAAETPSPGEVAAEANPDADTGSAASSQADDSDVEETEAADEGGDEEVAAADAQAAGDDGEMYELSEEEREAVKEEYGVGFSTGGEIPEAGEHDIDAPGPDEGVEPAGEATEDAAGESGGGDSDTGDDLGDFDAGSDEGESADGDEAEAEGDVFTQDEADGDDDLDDFTEDAYDEPESDAEDDESPPADVDLEDYVVDLMDDLDDGDGAPRDEVLTTAADDLEADQGDVEEAIQSALMSGRCYESGDDHLKAI
jgi:RPA family protein